MFYLAENDYFINTFATRKKNIISTEYEKPVNASKYL